jgi:sec-independent protein translocase protein TatB
MFDLFSWSHILILLAVALVVVGPKDLPKLMHMVGKWVGKARGLANEFKKSFDEMARQSELDELRKEIESLKNHQTVADVQVDLNSTNDTPAKTDLPEPGPEPRAGEFKVTETPPPLMTGHPSS